MLKSRARWGLTVSAMLVAACVPYVAPGNTGGAGITGTSTQPGVGTNGLSAAFKTGTLQVAQGETRALADLLLIGGQPPDAVTAASLSWRISDLSIAKLGTDGSVKGITQGSAVVTAFLTANPAVQAQIQLNVTPNQGAVQVAITPSSSVLKPGERVTLQAAVHLADGTVNSSVNWSSSDTTIATVNPTTGEVNGLKEGRVTIRGTYAADNTYAGVADVHVTDANGQASTAPSTVVFGGGPTPTPAPDATPTPIPLPGKWVAQVSGAAEDLNAVRFLDATHGFAVGAKGVIVTTTDGSTWHASYPVTLGFQDLSDGEFTADGVYLVIANGKLFRSTDAGVTWSDLSVGLTGSGSATSYSVRRFGSAGIFVNCGTAVVRSKDGGRTFQVIDLPDLGPQGSVLGLGASGDDVWISSGNKVYRKVAGVGWVSLGAPAGLQRIDFVSAQEAYGLSPSYGGVDYIFHTADTGKTWTQLTTSGLLDDAWPDALHGFALGQEQAGYDASNRPFSIGTVGVTNDGGRTWIGTPFSGGTLHGLRGIAAVSAKQAWVVGTAGDIYHYVPTPGVD